MTYKVTHVKYYKEVIDTAFIYHVTRYINLFSNISFT